MQTEGFEDEKNAEKDALKAETVRKIYVAATRARNALIVSSFGSRSRWKDFTPLSYPNILEFIKDSPATIISNTGSAEPDELYAEAENGCVFNNRDSERMTFDIVTPSKLTIVSKVSEERDVLIPDEDESELRRFASVIGTMVHKLMEMLVSSRGKKDPEEAVQEIISEFRTASMKPYAEKISEALSGVAKTVMHGGYDQTNGLPKDIFKALLDADEVFCEVPFCYKEDTPDGIVIWNGIMDVVYCSGGQWHIVDYKTNAEGNDLDTKYQNQLAAYVKAFKATTGNDADAGTYHIDV